jgi:RHS repeat-associated protein
MSYAYNMDDTVNFITDARGVKTTFGYDPRGLVVGLNYDRTNAPGVADTKNVTFGYDAPGNRTVMVESGQGTVNYAYDFLSRPTSEARGIDGVGTYTFNYAYNAAGQLQTVTNPFGSVVNYNYDATGQATSVAGSGAQSAANYVSSIGYRAFGGVKNISYGNTRQLSLQYNNRLFLTQWNLPNPSGANTSSTALGYSYDYNKYQEGHTGRVEFADSLYDATLDRAWTYDQVGRLMLAYTGTEANSNWGSEPDGPYARGYNYDQFGNLTSRYGWGGANRDAGANYSATFTTKNQRNGHSYDLAGNVTHDGGQSFTYDATGQQAWASSGNLAQFYDGDGLRLKKVENGTTTYYLRSTVLGQQVAAELNASGQWTRGFVYLGRQLVAMQDVAQNRVLWTHQEPFAKSQRITDSSGAIVAGVELEPFGLETNRSFDNSAVNQKRQFTTYDRDADNSDEAMFRRYNRWHDRFDQPDPYDGSYDAGDPQSFNRYAYTQGDPVNFVDPDGLLIRLWNCWTACVLTSGGWDCDTHCDLELEIGTPGGINPQELPRLSGGALPPRTIVFSDDTPPEYPDVPPPPIPKKCRQDASGDINDFWILDNLERAGLISFINRDSVRTDREGITFNVTNLSGLLAAVRADPRFQSSSFDPVHNTQVGGKGKGFRSFTGKSGLGGLGSLQLVVGPSLGTGLNVAIGYADFDCSNPSQDIVGFFRHIF